jgi:hypothetical protein
MKHFRKVFFVPSGFRSFRMFRGSSLIWKNDLTSRRGYCWGPPSLPKDLKTKELFATKGTECRSCNRYAQNAEGLEPRLNMVTMIRRGSELERKRPVYPWHFVTPWIFWYKNFFALYSKFKCYPFLYSLFSLYQISRELFWFYINRSSSRVMIVAFMLVFPSGRSVWIMSICLVEVSRKFLYISEYLSSFRNSKSIFLRYLKTFSIVLNMFFWVHWVPNHV